MPPTVMTPWFPAGCVLGVVLVGVVVAEPLPAGPDFAPELAGALDFVVAPERVFPPEVGFTAEAPRAAGVAPLLATCMRGVLPLLGACAPEIGVADAAPLLGVAAPELLAGAAVYDCPATAEVACCDVVEPPPRCAKSYAIAPPRARVAMTFNVMNTIATRSRMDPFSFGRGDSPSAPNRPS